jgi:hypothetical protein
MAKEGLQFEFSADTAEYRRAVESMPRDLQKAAGQIDQIGEQINVSMSKAVGMGLVQGLAGAGIALKLRDIISEFSGVANSAKRFGASAEDIQRVDFAAKTAGSSMEQVGSAMEAAGVRANKAAREGGALAEAFNRAGIDATAFSIGDLTTRIEMVAAAQSAASGDAQQLANVTEALGQQVATVNFKGMADGMREVNVVSNETVRQLDAANQEIVKFERSIKVGAAGGLGLVADHFERVGTAAAEASGGGISEAASGLAKFANLFNPVGSILASLNSLGLIDFSNLSKFLPATIQNLEEMQAALQPLPPLYEKSAAASDTASEATVNYAQVLRDLIAVNAEMEASMAKMEKGAGSLAAQLAEAELRLARLSQEFAQSGDAEVFKEIEKTAKEILSLRQQTAKEEEKIRAETTKTSEEYRKQADAQARAISSLDEEMQLLEAKLTGNKALTEEITRQQDFRKVFEETKDVEKADKFAELRAKERAMEDSGGGPPGSRGGSSRSSASAPRPQSALDRLRQSAQDDPRARAEMFRIQNEQSRAMDRAGAMREGGMFGSAARAEIRGERRAEQRAEKFRATEIATERFGGRNMGEAERNFRNMMAEQGIFGREQGSLQQWAKEQAKTETERKEEAQRSGGAGAGDGSAPKDRSKEIVGKLSQLIGEIKKRLPQNALAA